MISQYNIELGEKIRLHRLSAGYTGAELALAVETSPSSVSRWESGGSAINVVQLRSIALALGIESYWNLVK